MTGKNYCYTFIRLDLPIEQQIVQAAHSALEAGRTLGRPDQTSHLILLEAKSEFHLQEIAYELDCIGIKYHLFFEPDHERGNTSLTTEPIAEDDKNRAYFRRHKLYSYNPRTSYSCKDESFSKEKCNAPTQR